MSRGSSPPGSDSQSGAKSLAEVRNIKGTQRHEFHQSDKMIIYCVDVLDNQTCKQTKRVQTGTFISTLFRDKTRNILLSAAQCDAEIRRPV